jgi:hypothetical protein
LNVESLELVVFLLRAAACICLAYAAYHLWRAWQALGRIQRGLKDLER